MRTTSPDQPTNRPSRDILIRYLTAQHAMHVLREQQIRADELRPDPAALETVVIEREDGDVPPAVRRAWRKSLWRRRP